MRGKLSIFVIEGDHDTRVSLRAILEGEGHSVLSAANLSDALEKLGNTASPSVILVGSSIRTAAAKEILKQLAAYQKVAEVPVVEVSGLDRDKLLEAIRQALA